MLFEKWGQSVCMKQEIYEDGRLVGMSNQPETLNLRCELVSGGDVSQLEGELKTFVETLGFEPRREKATKDVLNTLLWDWFNYITGHILDHLKEKKEWYKENRQAESK